MIGSLRGLFLNPMMITKLILEIHDCFGLFLFIIFFIINPYFFELISLLFLFILFILFQQSNYKFSEGISLFQGYLQRLYGGHLRIPSVHLEQLQIFFV